MAKEQGLFKRACCYLVLLGGFFFLSYNLSNHFTATRSDVGELYYGWELSIPIVPWTIIPYWSIDFIYAFCVLFAPTRVALDTLAKRLLAAQVICIVSFFLFPLQFSFAKPELQGFFGWWFDTLLSFDKPYNQAPSLHITLLVVLWCFLSDYAQSWGRWLLNIWCVLIGVSVLSTWQHHFIDVPTGVLAGCLCVWLFPKNQKSPLCRQKIAKHNRMAMYYFVVGGVALVLARNSMQVWLVLWFSVSLGLVAVNYAYAGAGGFQKNAQGRFYFPIGILYFPYHVLARLNVWAWTRNKPMASMVAPNLYLGRLPTRAFLAQKQFAVAMDMCAELPYPKHQAQYHLFAVLDLTPVPKTICLAAAAQLERDLAAQKTILVSCALGYSRSATVVLAWLLFSRQATSAQEAMASLQKSHPHIVIKPEQLQILDEMLEDIHAKQ